MRLSVSNAVPTVSWSNCFKSFTDEMYVASPRNWSELKPLIMRWIISRSWVALSFSQFLKCKNIMKPWWLSWICGGLKADEFWRLSELSSDLQECDVVFNRASTKTHKHCLNIARIKGTSWKRCQASTVVQLSPLFFCVTQCRLVVGYWHRPNSISSSMKFHLQKPGTFFFDKAYCIICSCQEYILSSRTECKQFPFPGKSMLCCDPKFQ